MLCFGKSNGESEMFVAIGDRQLAVACVVFAFLCPRSLLVGWLWFELLSTSI
jgi:hypothetical protein